MPASEAKIIAEVMKIRDMLALAITRGDGDRGADLILDAIVALINARLPRCSNDSVGNSARGAAESMAKVP